ncbi:MAG: 50S ribosomal protein L15 [Bacteroidales bacterium]
MKLNNLKPAAGSLGRDRRRGRGEGSTRGGQSTRGQKGAQSRSGYSRRIGFEGGQMPIQRRIPKFGFVNHRRIEYKAVNLSVLQTISEKYKLDVINFDNLLKAGYISKNDRVKILSRGELTAKLEVHADAFSKTAKEKIESLEGKAIID